MIGTLSRKRAAFAPLARYFGVNQGFLPFLWCALQLQQFPVSALQLGTPNERGKLRKAKQERASGANDSPFRQASADNRPFAYGFLKGDA